MDNNNPLEPQLDISQRAGLSEAYVRLLASDDFRLWHAQAEQNAAYDVLSMFREIADGADVPEPKLRALGAVWNYIAFAPNRMRDFVTTFEGDADKLVKKEKDPSIDLEADARGI